VAGTPDGSHLYVLGQGDNRICIYNTHATTGDVTGILGCVPSQGKSESLRVSSDGQYLAVANSDGNVTTFKILSNGVPSKIGSWPAGKSPIDVAIHPSAPFVAVVSYDDNKLHLFKFTSSGQLSEIGTWDTGKHPASVVFAPSSGLIVTANDIEGTLSVFGFDADAARVTPRGSVQNGPGSVALAVFTLQDTGQDTARDFNGDGKADLEWHHQTTGQVAVWLLDGTTLTRTATVGAAGDLAWQLR